MKTVMVDVISMRLCNIMLDERKEPSIVPCQCLAILQRADAVHETAKTNIEWATELLKRFVKSVNARKR